ncbi:hypothetical protein DKL61_08745 [Gammaproteobacteria bacterium ESL0073]|nr:hypothetical protein DKL61_08745 [Gammaproteobacteria bacterium ESL0073]
MNYDNNTEMQQLIEEIRQDKEKSNISKEYIYANKFIIAIKQDGAMTLCLDDNKGALSEHVIDRKPIYVFDVKLLKSNDIDGECKEISQYLKKELQEKLSII